MALQRIDCKLITEGVRFTAPVFFDDGINMFLAAGHPAKRYHIAAIRRWKVPFLLTSGSPITDSSIPLKKTAPVEDLEELEEVQELDDITELEEL